MKLKFYILSILFLMASFAISQESAVDRATVCLQSKDYAKAIPLLDKAITDSKTSIQARTWYYRGFAYKDKYNETNDTNDRKVAIESLLKTLQLDKSDEFKVNTLQVIKYVINSIYNDAVREMNASNFGPAHIHFNKYVNIIEKTFPTELTSELVFYTGYTAYMSHNMEPARSYFEKARSMNHPDPLLYEFLGKEYWELGQKEKSIEILDEGTVKYPHNKDLNLLEIDYLLKMGNTTRATTKLDRAIKLDPTNIGHKVLQGQLYEMQAKFDKANAKSLTSKARVSYQNVLTQSANNWKANYNLALSYYNEGVNMMNNLSEDDEDIFALMEIQDVSIDLFKKALPYMEKAHKLQPDNMDVLIGLSGIYFSLNNADKATQIQDQISIIKGKDK